jgi:hypothetical protein
MCMPWMRLSSGCCRKDMYLLTRSFQNMIKLDLLLEDWSIGSVEREQKGSVAKTHLHLPALFLGLDTPE